MSNEILRYKNKSNAHETVSVASFGDKSVKRVDNQNTSLFSFFKSEREIFNEKLSLEETVPVEKPKLYEPREVFNYMKEKNPNLAELVKVLGGEISY